MVTHSSGVFLNIGMFRSSSLYLENDVVFYEIITDPSV